MDNYGDGETLANTNSHNGLRPPTSVFDPQYKVNQEFEKRVDNGEIDYDVVVPVNKRLSKNGDKGHKTNNPYPKYDFAVFDYDTPKDFEKSIKEAGYNSVDEFRKAYDKDPEGMAEKFKKNGQINNMTFEAKRNIKGNRGSVQGDSGKWGKIYNSGDKTKYKYGITDDGTNKNYTDSDYPNIPRTYIKYHTNPKGSEGCITSTCEKSNQAVTNNLEQNIPSLSNNKENSYQYVPSNGDNYKGINK
jgi:hypothetical protein